LLNLSGAFKPHSLPTDSGEEPKIWAGKFPYQVKVKLVLPKVTEVPKSLLKQMGLDPSVGRFDNCLDEDLAEDLVRGMLGGGV